MRTLIPVQIALLLLVTESSASAITIDNFEEGPFSLSTSNSAQCHDLPPPLPPGIRICEDTQSGLSTLNVISGQRSVFLQPSGSGTADGTAELALTAGDDAAVVDAPADAQNGFSYAFASPFDLTQGGTLDRFVVDITAASGLELVLTVAQHSSGIGPNLFFSESLQISGSGAFTVLFSDLRYFGLPPGPVLDFTQVDGVVMYFDGIGSISNIAAIPEPSTALLVIAGLLGLGGWRRVSA